MSLSMFSPQDVPVHLATLPLSPIHKCLLELAVFLSLAMDGGDESRGVLLGLQLALLFIRMSNQACNSCDQLLGEGDWVGRGQLLASGPALDECLVSTSLSVSFCRCLYHCAFYLFVCLSFPLPLCIFLFFLNLSPWAVGSDNAFM